MPKISPFTTLMATLATSMVCTSTAQAEEGVTFYGQLNYGVLSYDDGVSRENYFVDNDGSSSRIGLNIFLPKTDTGQLRFNFETDVGTTKSDGINQQTGNGFSWDWKKTALRKVELIYKTDDYGTFYAGQGSMASDTVAYSDFAGTTIAATTSVMAFNGSQLFRFSDGTLSNVRFNAVSRDFDGARRFRVRYDTPSYAGFTLSGAYGREVLKEGDDRDYSDIALRYRGAFGDLTVAGGFGYNWQSGGQEFGVVSAGVLHVPTGLNATIVGGHISGGGNGFYTKLGLNQSFFGDDAYKTSFSIDYYSGNDLNGVGSDTKSVGFVAVQNFGDNFQAYTVYRTHDYDDLAGDYLGGKGFFIGARWKFELKPNAG